LRNGISGSSLHAMDTDDRLLSEKLALAVELLADVFAARSVRHALIGGLAVSMRGRPRLTQDVDVLVEVPQIELPGLIEALVERGFSIDPAVAIKEYVRDHMTSFQLGPVRIDWLKPVLPLYSRAIQSASPLDWSEGHPIRVATAEGLILTKMVSFRPQDQMDIETLLTANRDTIDVQQIRDEWSPFADTEAERTAWLEATIARRVVRRE
jgi:hypothetical protein